MKWLLAIQLVLSVPIVYAVECGPLVQYNTLFELENAVREAGFQLLQHEDSLQREIDGLLNYAPTQATLREIARIERDQSLLAYAQNTVATLEAALQSASTLAGIRDVMVDHRDKAIVERFLSSSASFIRRSAETKLPYVNQLLAKLSRPGLAIDMARLRDSVGAAFKELAHCESPKMPFRDTKVPK